jgi:hypothetical protein
VWQPYPAGMGIKKSDYILPILKYSKIFKKIQKFYPQIAPEKRLVYRS